MKPLTTALIAALLIVSGCATDAASQRQQMAEYDRNVTAAADALADAIEAGVLTDPKIIAPARVAVNEANAIGRKLRATTQPTDTRFWLLQGTQTLTRIAAYVAQAEKEKAH